MSFGDSAMILSKELIRSLKAFQNNLSGKSHIVLAQENLPKMPQIFIFYLHASIFQKKTFQISKALRPLLRKWTCCGGV